MILFVMWYVSHLAKPDSVRMDVGVKGYDLLVG